MLEYIYGYYPVVNSLKSDSLITIKKVIMVAKKYNELILQLKSMGITYEIKSIEKINNLLKTSKNQGICGEVSSYKYFNLVELLQKKPNNKFYRFIICDKITDPHNFGAMIRIAAGNDFDGIIILNRNQAQINSVVVKAAAGAASTVPICIVNNLAATIKELQKQQTWIFASDYNEKAVNYQELKYDFNIALIIGNEGDGVSSNLLKKADVIVKIPMSNKIESFNASVACGIITQDIYLKTLKLHTSNK